METQKMNADNRTNEILGAMRARIQAKHDAFGKPEAPMPAPSLRATSMLRPGQMNARFVRNAWC